MGMIGFLVGASLLPFQVFYFPSSEKALVKMEGHLKWSTIVVKLSETKEKIIFLF